MTREEALELLESCDTWECIPNKVINKIFDDHEAETTQLKERIAELEAENELCEKVHLMAHNENQTNLNRIAELEAELKRKDKEESELLTIAYLQGSGKTSRLKRFARKIYDELQELKGGAVDRDKTYTITIREKKQ